MVVNITRDKQYLYFTLPDGRCEVRYDLQLKQMQRLNLKNHITWRFVEHSYEYFKGVALSDLSSPESKFLAMIQKTRGVYRNCTSVSTFVARLGSVLVTEQFEEEHIRCECSSSYCGNPQIVSKPLNWYPKYMILLFKKAQPDFIVTRNFESSYTYNKVFFDKICMVAATVNLTSKNASDLLYGFTNRWEYLRDLTEQYNYDTKALLNYIFGYLEPFENIKFNEAVNLLRDYYRMASMIGRDIKKYPKYLKSMHDIITANYNAFKQEYDEQKFAELIKTELEYADNNFCIVLPKSTKDIISEGTTLNHCVSSYVDRILRGETYIVFLRKKAIPESSLVTVEIRDKKIVQARGAYNRDLIEEEQKFLSKYCTEKQIELQIK